ncbi:hypothetical protein ACQEUU_16835 [Nonomuraea sp. CA-218870]|uniref:hypothetical protein n=1 Tax=Nonomuraea sp. CA-218870 TaxID=3239998 RepID=UPI003D93CAE9
MTPRREGQAFPGILSTPAIADHARRFPVAAARRAVIHPRRRRSLGEGIALIEAGKAAEITLGGSYVPLVAG